MSEIVLLKLALVLPEGLDLQGYPVSKVRKVKREIKGKRGKKDIQDIRVSKERKGKRVTTGKKDILVKMEPPGLKETKVILEKKVIMGNQVRKGSQGKQDPLDQEAKGVSQVKMAKTGNLDPGDQKDKRATQDLPEIPDIRDQTVTLVLGEFPEDPEVV